MFYYNNLLIIFVTTLLLACGGRDNGQSLSNVLGEVDPRRDIEESTQPYLSIGRLDVGCTGTLIHERLVLTALHCLIEEIKKDSSGDEADHATDRLVVNNRMGYFRPNLIKGRSRHLKVGARKALPVRFWYTTKDPVAERGKDIAIVELDEPLGEEVGYLGLGNYNITERNLPASARLVGYSADVITYDDDDRPKPLLNGNKRRDGYTASEDPNCRMYQDYKSLITHDCAQTKGASGGPIFKKIGDDYEVFAIQVAQFPGASNTDYQPELILPKNKEKKKPNANIALNVYPYEQQIAEIIRLHREPAAIDWSAIGWRVAQVKHDRSALQEKLALPEGADQALSSSDKWYLGVKAHESVYGVDQYGLAITEVAEGGPADNAGLEVNDLIVSINRMPTKTHREYSVAMTGGYGSAVVTIIRNGVTMDIRDVELTRETPVF